MHAFILFLRRLSAVPIYIASAALMALMVMTFCDVVLRSVLNAPIEEATELTRIFLAITVFSVLPIISAQGEHISVDLTDGIFYRLGLQEVRDGAVFLVSGILMIWPTLQVIKLAERARSYGDVTEYLRLPEFYIIWLIALACGLSALAMIVTGLLHFFAPATLREGP